MQNKDFYDKIIKNLKYKNKNMSGIESKDKFDKQIEDKNKFYKEFNDKEGKNPDFQKYFGEIIDGTKFDDSKSGEENFKNAFNSKVDDLIDKNFKNITPERKKELEKFKNATEGMSPKELLSAYKDIKSIIGTGNAESYKSTDDKRHDDGKKENDQAKNKLSEFMDSLKESIKEERKLEEQKRAREKKKMAEAEQERQQVQTAELNNVAIEGFPVPETPNTQTA